MVQLPQQRGRLTIAVSFPPALPQFLLPCSTVLPSPGRGKSSATSRKSLYYSGNQPTTCQGDRFFFGALQQFKFWLLLRVEAWQHVNTDGPAERDANPKYASDELLIILFSG